MPPKIIGISGTNGSGKDSVGRILVQKHNYLFVSGSDMLRHDLKRRGIPLNRDETSKLSAAWRTEFGLGVIINKAVDEYEKQGGSSKYAGLAIASLRNPGEADRVHELGGKVIWIDADPKLRYERIRANSVNRGKDRAESDNVSFNQFLADEAREMDHKGEHKKDPTILAMGLVKEKSDLLLINDGNDMSQLETKLNRLLGFSLS